MPFDFTPHFARALPYRPFLEKYATPEQRDRWQNLYEQITLTPAQQSLLAGFRRVMPVLCMAGPWCGDCVNACPIFQKFAEAAPDTIDLRFINRAQRFEAAPTPGGDTENPDDIRTKPIGKILVKWGILTPEKVQKAVLEQEEAKAKGLNVRIGDVMIQSGMITPDQRDRALANQGGFASLDQADREVALELSICGAPRVPILVFFTEDMLECARFGERTLATYRQKAASLQGASCPTGLIAPPSDLLATNVEEWLNHFERTQLMLLTSPRLMKLHGEI